VKLRIFDRLKRDRCKAAESRGNWGEPKTTAHAPERVPRNSLETALAQRMWEPQGRNELYEKKAEKAGLGGVRRSSILRCGNNFRIPRVSKKFQRKTVFK